MGCNLEMKTRMRGTIGAWSGCQEPWEKACIFSLVSVSSLSLLFANPRFSSMDN